MLGVVTVLIASKYFEIRPPTVDSLINITRNTYTKQELLNMEYRVLSAISYDVNVPLMPHFVDRFSKLTQANSKINCLAHYLSELTLMKTSMHKWLPSRRASASIYLSRKMLN